MAFSQVETVSSLGIDSVLRDRNRQDVCFKVLVKDHVRNFTPFESASPDENSQSRRIDSWIETTRSAGHARSKKESVSASPRGSSIRKRENLDPGRPDKLSRNDNLGASSLVQIWEARVNKSNGGDAANQSKSTVCSSRSSSGISTVENSCPAPLIDGESNPTVEVVNISNGWNAGNQIKSTISSSRSSSSISTIENFCPAAPGESDPTVQIESAVSSDDRDSVSDLGNGERVKVADIVRTLTTDQRKPNKKGAKELSGLKIQRPPPISSSMVEIKSFSLVCPSPRIRGRQALSDLLMQMERDRHRELASLLKRHAVSTFPKRGRLQSILKLRSLQRCVAIQDRQRSNSKAAGQNRFQSESAVSQLRDKFRTNSRKSATELTQCSSPASQPEEDGTVLVPSGTERPDTSNKTADTCLDTQETSVSNGDDKIQSTVSSEFVENERKNEEEDVKTHWRPFFRASETMSSVQLDSCKNEKVEEDLEGALMNFWEEEYNDQDYYYGDANYDWFSEICRPRSYWEDLRKYRYLEVISTRSENEEICRLLERRTVSGFLESEMREKIDRLMASRTETQFGYVGNQEQHLDPWEIAKEEEEKVEVEEEEEEEEQEQREEQENGNSCSDNSSQSSSQTFLPSPGRSWSSRDPEIRSTHPLPIKHPSSETELLNNLREQMELLQGEILELRKSVKKCTDMNLQLQESVNRVNPLKLKCCICSEKRVEALLYRCGHICTCMKCGNELQWNSGKCPICRASIQDVVRVYLDSTHPVKTNS